MASPLKKSAKVQLIELRNGGTPFEELLAADFDRGLTPRMLAHKYDMHFTALYDYAREYGLKPPGRYKRPTEDTALVG